jgi:hypothetical protein
MNESNTTNSRHSRHTITIDHPTFLRLKSKGRFGESYSQLITRILDHVESVTEKDDTYTIDTKGLNHNPMNGLNALHSCAQ